MAQQTTAYRVRRALWERESLFRLDEGRLIRTVAGRERQALPLEQIEHFTLTYTPTPLDRWVLSARAARRPRIWIPSLSYAGLGDFADQAEAFDAFCRTLQQEVVARRGAVAFNAGSWPLALIWGATTLIAWAFAALGALLAVVGALSGRFSLVMVGASALFMIQYARLASRGWRANRVRPLEPGEHR